ncbi:rRNA-processing protein EBP2 [Coniosporium apollinis]|uniref:rRNA-processing protein EBP2 n=1 Tax=Coniosporium apollinis TaxID=61459 RepID=A0ABQ9NND9_9PEZI|nr:rRNA-processing protein EBP2 [Coniosporium apollinis]
MARKGATLAAFERLKGIDKKADKEKKQQRKQQRKAEEKRAKKAVPKEVDDGEEEEAGIGDQKVAQEGVPDDEIEIGVVDGTIVAGNGEQDGEWHTEEELEADSEDEDDGGTHLDAFKLANIDDSDLSSSDDDDDNDEPADTAAGAEDEDIAYSDLESVASEEKGDIVPHQRLTINNTSALLAAHKRIALPLSKLPFSEHQSLTTSEPVSIADIEDDLNRELAFYAQSLSAVKEARSLLKAEGVPFSRPPDYFAEMVKSDEHMGKIKQKLVDEAAGKKAAADARRQRDLKKFGKQVQVAKMQERDKAKRDTMEKINILKRKRKDTDPTNDREDDLFDVALEDAAVTEKKDRDARRAGGKSSTARGPGGKPNPKRAKKNEKYGFGGKKRFAKSNDATSSADMRDFSAKKMKGGAAKRPGKSRRAKQS